MSFSFLVLPLAVLFGIQLLFQLSKAPSNLENEIVWSLVGSPFALKVIAWSLHIFINVYISVCICIYVCLQVDLKILHGMMGNTCITNPRHLIFPYFKTIMLCWASWEAPTDNYWKTRTRTNTHTHTNAHTYTRTRIHIHRYNDTYINTHTPRDLLPVSLSLSVTHILFLFVSPLFLSLTPCHTPAHTNTHLHTQTHRERCIS